MMNETTIAGKRLRQARKAAFPDLPAAEVARRLNITRQTLNNYENDRSQPSADVLVRMAVLYSVDVRELATIQLDRMYTASVHSRTMRTKGAHYETD